MHCLGCHGKVPASYTYDTEAKNICYDAFHCAYAFVTLTLTIIVAEVVRWNDVIRSVAYSLNRYR